MITVSIDGGRVVMAHREDFISGRRAFGVKMTGWNKSCGKVVGAHFTEEQIFLLLTSKGRLYFSATAHLHVKDFGGRGNTVDLVVRESNWAEAKEIANLFATLKLDSDDYFVSMGPTDEGTATAVFTHKGKLRIIHVTENGEIKIRHDILIRENKDERVVSASTMGKRSFRIFKKNDKNDLLYVPPHLGRTTTEKFMCIPMAGDSKSVDVTYSAHSTRVYYIQKKALWVSEMEHVSPSYGFAVLSEAIASSKILFARVINTCGGVSILTVAEGGRVSWSTVDKNGTIQFHSESLIPNLEYTSIDYVELSPKGDRYFLQGECYCKRTYILLSARTGEILIGFASSMHLRGFRYQTTDSHQEGEPGNVIFDYVMTMLDTMDPSLQRNCVKEVVFASRTAEEDELKDNSFLFGALCETKSGRSYVSIYTTNYPFATQEKIVLNNSLLCRLILENDHSRISHISLVGSRSNGASLIAIVDNSQIVMWKNVHLNVHGRVSDSFKYSLPNSVSELSWLNPFDSSTRSITSLHATTFPEAETMAVVLYGTDKGELVLECEDEGAREETKEIIRDLIHTGECIAVRDIRSGRIRLNTGETLHRTLVVFAVQGKTILICRVMLPFEKNKNIQLLILRRIQTAFSSISLIDSVVFDEDDTDMSIPRLLVVSPIDTNGKSGVSVIHCCKKRFLSQWNLADKEWEDEGRKALKSVPCPGDQSVRRSLEAPRLKKGKAPVLSEIMLMMDSMGGEESSRRFDEKDVAIVMPQANVDFRVAQECLLATNGVMTSAVEEAKRQRVEE